MFERDFQNEVTASVIPLGNNLGKPCHFFKIPDFPYSRTKEVAEDKKIAFLPRKGYDCFLVVDGKHYALELKLAKKMAIPFKALDEVQEYHLLACEAAGGSAYVVVNFRSILGEKEAKKRNASTVNKTFAIPIHWWVGLRTTIGRESLPLERLEADGLELPRLPGHGIRWDLRPLLV